MENLSDIQRQIQETLGAYETLRHVNNHVDEIELQLEEAYKKIKAMDKLLDKELKDISDLEEFGIKSFFHKTLGTKEQQLEKERQEYLELSLKYKEYKSEIELMEYERDLLAKKLDGIPKLEDKLRLLKESRKSEIMSGSETTIKKDFLALMSRLDTHTILQREISEAMHEGSKSLEYLAKIIAYLDKAEEWGRWDMYGDNRRAGYLKQQSIDKAVRLLPQVQHQLNLFKREMKDLGEKNIVLQLDTIHIRKFRDFFFDNLISDWIVQQRIRSTLNSVAATKAHVERIVLSLQQELLAVTKATEELNIEKENMIIS